MRATQFTRLGSNLLALRNGDFEDITIEAIRKLAMEKHAKKMGAKLSGPIVVSHGDLIWARHGGYPFYPAEVKVERRGEERKGEERKCITISIHLGYTVFDECFFFSYVIVNSTMMSKLFRLFL